jgi:hypothetical protein
LASDARRLNQLLSICLNLHLQSAYLLAYLGEWLSSEGRRPPAGEAACFGAQQPAEFATAAATAAVEATVEQQRPELAAAEAPALIPGTATAECDRRLATAEAFATATAAGHVETAAPWTTAATTTHNNRQIKNSTIK